MSIRYYLFLFFVFSFSTALSQDVSDDFNKLRRLTKKLVRKKKVPGIAIGIVSNNQLVFSEGYGYANIAKNQKVSPSHTIFRIASVSKPIAAIGLARLYADNQVDLDASIYGYLPDFPKKSYDFTLKQLGGHLAGIRGYKNNEFKNDKAISIREGIDIFKNDKLLFEPGTQFFYTSYGWNLIAHTIESITHLRFEDFINEEVLQPIGMRNTFADHNQNLQDKAVFYSKKRNRKFKPAVEVNNYYKLAGGGYLSTTEDLTIFGNALLNNDLVNASILEEFTKAQEINGKSTYYGIGFESSFDHKGRPYFGHTGNGLGGYAIFRVYPEDNMVITMLMNCSNPNQDKRFNEMIDAIFENQNE